MPGKKTARGKQPGPLKKLSFLIGKWHTEGLVLPDGKVAAKKIRGMDTYEWIAGGHFILHRADVFMGSTRIEVLEIIGYDESRGCYFMTSYDNQGESLTLYATLEKPGVLKLGDKKMRALLTADKKGNPMRAKWEISGNGETWKHWMDVKLHK